MQFVGVHLLLLRVNRACETNRSMTVDDNLDELLEATMVELSGLRIDRNRVRLVTVGREVEQTSAVVRASEERLVERRVTSSIGELLQRVVGGNHEPFGVGPDAVPLQLGDEGVPIGPDLDLLLELAEPLHTGIIGTGHRLATGWPQAGHGSRPTSGSRASCRREGRCLIHRIRLAPPSRRGLVLPSCRLRRKQVNNLLFTRIRLPFVLKDGMLPVCFLTQDSHNEMKVSCILHIYAPEI